MDNYSIMVLRAILTNDKEEKFMALPKPTGIQIEVLDLKPKGHQVILGTAGSGKTTIAIYRAAYLAKLDKTERVLIITFNKTLVKYLESISEGELDNIDVCNYHKFARGYLNSRNKMPKRNGIVSGRDDDDTVQLSLIKKAIQSVIWEVGINSTLKRDPNVFLEEISWLEKMGVKTLNEYETAERIGRANMRVLRENRKYFYMVYQAYIEKRTQAGYLYDWDDIAIAVCNEFENDSTDRWYKHIVIDEGQDLSPMMLKSLTMAIPPDGTLTFFGDVAQQIYGGRISWRDAGLNIEKHRIWRFDRNYRNSKEITKLAIAISKSPYFMNEVDLVEPIMPTASAPLPAVVKFSDENNEISWIVESAISMSTASRVAILARDRKTVNDIVELLHENKVRPQVLKSNMVSWNEDAKISVGTFHSAKGLEFDTVLIPYCSKERLPSEERIQTFEGRDEALKEEIKLIYVAVTRAKRGLIITFTGEKTEMIPENNGLYSESEG